MALFSLLKHKALIHKFNKKFVQFNKYTLQAFKVQSDEEFKKLCWKCIEETAKQNKKDIKSISLEDIYRVLYKIRKKFPKILRRVTLNQFIKCQQSISLAGDAGNIIYFISHLTPVPLIYLGVKKAVGKKVEYAFKMYMLTWIAQEIYKGGRNTKK